MESESFIIRNFDLLIILALVFGVSISFYMRWIDKKRSRESSGEPTSKGIFIKYLLITLMPLLVLMVVHMVLEKFQREPDSMFAYVPYILLSAALSVFLMHGSLKKAQVKNNRFWAYFMLILGFILPMAGFINVYRPLSQEIIEVKSVEDVTSIPLRHDFIHIESFEPRIDKFHSRFSERQGSKDYQLYFTGWIPLATNREDTVFSTWMMIDRSKKLSAQSESDSENFKKECLQELTTYSFSGIKFFIRHHQQFYVSSLRESGRVQEPLVIMTPSHYTKTEMVEDSFYGIVGVYVIVSLGFLGLVKFKGSSDTIDY